MLSTPPPDLLREAYNYLWAGESVSAMAKEGIDKQQKIQALAVELYGEEQWAAAVRQVYQEQRSEIGVVGLAAAINGSVLAI